MFHFELNELEDFCQDEFENDLYVTVQVEKPDTPSACPHCDAKMYRHGYYNKEIERYAFLSRANSCGHC